MLVFTKMGKNPLKPMSQIPVLLKLVAFSYCLQRMQAHILCVAGQKQFRLKQLRNKSPNYVRITL